MTETDMAAWSGQAKDLHAYWRNLAPGDGLLPGRRHVEPMDIPALLPHIWLMDIAGDPRDSRYRLIGTAVTAGVGKDYTGLTLRDAHPASADDPAALGFLKTVAETREPLWYRGPPRFQHQKDVAELENLVLPLASDGTTVDMLLGLSVFFRNDGTQVV